MRMYHKTVSLVLVLLLTISLFTVPLLTSTAPAAAAAQTVYTLSDLGLSEGDNVPVATAPGQYGRFSGDDSTVVYHTDTGGDYITLTHPEGGSDFYSSFGFRFPDTVTSSIVTVDYQLRFQDPIATDLGSLYHHSGFYESGKTLGFDNYAIRLSMNGNGQYIWGFAETPYIGRIRADEWYDIKLVLNLDTGEYEQYIGGWKVPKDPTNNPGVYSSPEAISRFLLTCGLWGGPAVTYDIRGLNIIFETPEGEDPGGGWGDETAAYMLYDNLTLYDLDNGEELPEITQGNFGLVNGDVRFMDDGTDRFVRVSDTQSPDDYVNTFGFLFPEGETAPVITAEYMLRINGKGSDHFFDPAAWLDAGYAKAAKLVSGDYSLTQYTPDGYLLLNYQGRLLSPALEWSDAVDTLEKGDDGYLKGDKWYSFKMVWDRANGNHWLFVNNSEEYWCYKKSVSVVDINDFNLFYLAFKKWGTPSGTILDIKDMTVTFGTEKPLVPVESEEKPQNPYVPSENAQVWQLNDQIADFEDGDSLPVHDRDVKEVFSAYIPKGRGSITAQGMLTEEPGVALEYGISDHFAGQPNNALVLELPNAVFRGKLFAFFRVSSTADSTWHWQTIGFGSNTQGQGSNISAGLILNATGDAYAQVNGNTWKGISKYSKRDEWYTYYMELDLNDGKVYLKEYVPGTIEPKSYEYDFVEPDVGKEIDQFVFQTYTSETMSGILNIQDVMVAYEPSEVERSHILYTPEDNDYMITRTPEFTWKATNAESYTLEISKTDNFSTDTITIGDIPETTRRSYTYVLTEALEYDTRYYWKVTYHYPDAEDSVSPVYQFVTEMQKAENSIYNAGSHELIEGDWIEPLNYNAGNADDIASRQNVKIIQGLLDMAGRYGGGTVILPAGTYRLRGDISKAGQNTLEIRYDNLTLTGQGKEGRDKTTLKTSCAWDPPSFVFRNTGIAIIGAPQGSLEARQHIELSSFEIDGGRSHTGAYDWGYDATIDYGWDIGHQGIAVNRDRLVTHVLLDNIHIHRFSGEQLYVGGLNTGYLEVRNCISEDTNASTFNLHAAYLYVHGNQFGGRDTQCRFWIEYCNRMSYIDYDMPALPDHIPEELKKDTAIFSGNQFYNALNPSEGIALCQGDTKTYTMYFEDNLFDNEKGSNQGAFLFLGSVYGPIYIRNNTFRNIKGFLVSFAFGGGTLDEDGNSVNWYTNKNIYFEGNTCENIGGPFLNIRQNGYPIDTIVIRGNVFSGSGQNTRSIIIGGPGTGNILTNAVIDGNTFKNCIAPEETGSFSGNMPLFKDNIYEDSVVSTTLGSIANLTTDNTLIKPFFEYMTLQASTEVIAKMRTGKNEDNQQVTLTGGANTAPVVFEPGAAGYEVPETKVIGPGNSIIFQYDAVVEKWIYIEVDKEVVSYLIRDWEKGEGILNGSGKNIKGYRACGVLTAVYDDETYEVIDEQFYFELTPNSKNNLKGDFKFYNGLPVVLEISK